MRVPDWPVGSRGGALGWAFSPGRKHDRISDGRVHAGGCVHDPRSERPRGGRLSRLPPAFGRRMVGASDRRGSGTGIRADLVASGEPRDRAAHRVALDARPGIPCDPGGCHQGIADYQAYGCEPCFSGHVRPLISASTSATPTARVWPTYGSAWSPERVSVTTRPDFDSASLAMNWPNGAG